jgi:hypothetical protein
MDNPTRSIADQVAALESAREAAEDEVTTLKDALAKTRDFLTAVLDGRAEAQDFDPADEPQPATPVHTSTTVQPEPRLSREEAEAYRKATDTAVLSVLTEHAGTEIRVATIVKQLVDEGLNRTDREVSQSLQRLRNTVGVPVRPAVKKGYWYHVVVPVPAENGTHAERHVAEEPVEPEDGASALEEAGVVRGDEWSSPDRYARI